MEPIFLNTMYPLCPFSNYLIYSKFTLLHPALWSWVWDSTNYISLLYPPRTPVRFHEFGGGAGHERETGRQEEERRTCCLLAIQVNGNPVKGFLPDSSSCPRLLGQVA